MSKKISHSAWDKYLTCPKMYDIHYNQRLRPKGTTSALKFGVAMDDGLNCLLEKKDLDMGIDAFRASFQWEDMNDVEWDDRDMDNSIVQRSSSDTDSLFAWKCMRVKGRMLMEEYFDKIYPKIEKVIAIQRNIDSRPGILDAVVQIGGKVVLLDHKTSARPYAYDAVKHSTQLALYAKDQGIKRAGFAVLVKQIKSNAVKICKKCGHDGSGRQHKTCPKVFTKGRCHGQWDITYSPEAEVQLIIDDVPERNGKMVEESMTQTEKAIEAGIFPRNLKACEKVYGKPCPYADFCWKGKKTMLDYKPKGEK